MFSKENIPVFFALLTVGGIALGHPVGATGCRLMIVSLVYGKMVKRRNDP